MTKKKRRAPQPKYVDYQFQVRESDLSYSYGLNDDPRFHDDAYGEHFAIQLRGPLLEPEIKGVRVVQLYILQQERNILPELDDYRPGPDASPLGVGSVTRRGGVLDGLISLPKHAIPIVVAILRSGGPTFVSLYGPKRYREMKVRYVSFRTERED